MTHGGVTTSMPAVSAAYLQGQVDELRAQLAALEAADEHHRSELAAALAGAAEARTSLQEAQKRLADRDATVGDLRKRCEAAQVAQARAEQERTAIIAALGWRVKRRLEQNA